MARLKTWLQDFPGTNAGHAAAILLILTTGAVVEVRLARGLVFPSGYDSWLVLLGALAGVSTLGMGLKRVTDREYRAAATSPVQVGGPSTVTVEASTAAPAAPARSPDPDPDK